MLLLDHSAYAHGKNLPHRHLLLLLLLLLPPGCHLAAASGCSVAAACCQTTLQQHLQPCASCAYLQACSCMRALQCSGWKLASL
jgi:hypothetical protein